VDNEPKLRAFAICRVCCEIYPSERGCPRCEGDAEAAHEVRAARADAVAAVASEQPGPPAPPPLRPHAAWKPVAAVVGVSLLVSTLVAVLAQA
jgi:hypothetical protein